jgi:hypothetical protein
MVRIGQLARQLEPAISTSVRNKNAVVERTLIDKFIVSGAMIHFTFSLVLAAVHFCSMPVSLNHSLNSF